MEFNVVPTTSDDISITVGSPHKVVTNLETFVNYSVETNVSPLTFLFQFWCCSIVLVCTSVIDIHLFCIV